jgi:hypothetical protein
MQQRDLSHKLPAAMRQRTLEHHNPGATPRSQSRAIAHDAFMLTDPNHEKSDRAMTAVMKMKKLDIAALQRAFDG